MLKAEGKIQEKLRILEFSLFAVQTKNSFFLLRSSVHPLHPLHPLQNPLPNFLLPSIGPATIHLTSP